MLYVLGPSRRKVEEWRRSVGLPARGVTPLTTESSCRGRRLRYDEVVKLVGFDLPPVLVAAIVPCGVHPDKISVVEPPMTDIHSEPGQARQAPPPPPPPGLGLPETMHEHWFSRAITWLLSRGEG